MASKSRPSTRPAAPAETRWGGVQTDRAEKARRPLRRSRASACSSSACISSFRSWSSDELLAGFDRAHDERQPGPAGRNRLHDGLSLRRSAHLRMLGDGRWPAASSLSTYGSLNIRRCFIGPCRIVRRRRARKQEHRQGKPRQNLFAHLGPLATAKRHLAHQSGTCRSYSSPRPGRRHRRPPRLSCRRAACRPSLTPTLYGRPVIETEYSAALGRSGRYRSRRSSQS